MMGTVRLAEVFPGSAHEAERCWYDTARWPAWVDGLARVVEVRGNWPQAGASVVWESGPAGRGTVHERVSEHQQLSGQTVEVEDDSLHGRQSVSFTPVEGGVEVELALEYQIRRRSLLTPLVDALFVRRVMAISLRKTLSHFGAQLAAARRREVG